MPVKRASSPLDVAGAGLDLTAEEIVAAIRESRGRYDAVLAAVPDVEPDEHDRL